MKLFGEAIFLTTFLSSSDLSHEGNFKENSIASLIPSIRMQIKPAIDASKLLGLNTITITPFHDIAELNIKKPRICIIGKLTSDPEKQKEISEKSLLIIRYFKNLGAKILLIYSDDWCSRRDNPIDEIRSILYKNLIKLSDSIVFTTSSMIQYGIKYSQGDTIWTVIEDPCSLKRLPFPSLNIHKTCKIIWYGMRSNSKYLVRELPLIYKNCNAMDSFELTVLGEPKTHDLVKQTLSQLKPIRKWKVRFSLWDIEGYPAQLEKSHIALLPSDRTSIEKRAASHNRVVDALQSGCMVITSPLPSYNELSKAIIITDNFPLAINSGIKDYQRLTKKWDNLRVDLLERFLPDENKRKWYKFIRHVVREP